ncbi:hypothetical protein Fleli_3812 [Bernardetia litoralis DSM 6794]|uniref:Uncharacterized protein n=1 Tax=Bernardetia litoralis (strain ATCC 23117 / DSM 6794 / NBRC 15988 / NCIMB 1366 / Fx l1 / Sio-4) TaxID=880071 RepID=I4AQ83_BERLS|nr:hypothetical protein Fleli_3812 [Bernardetia litoralis DSM 6794]
MKFEKSIAPNIAKIVLSSSVIVQEELKNALTYEVEIIEVK